MTELPSKQLESFIKFAEDCQENYSIFYSCVGDEDKRLQDLLHALEFTDNKYDMHNEALKLWMSRRERRVKKDAALLNREIAEYFQEGNEKSSSMSSASCWAGRGKRSSIWKGIESIESGCRKVIEGKIVKYRPDKDSYFTR